MNRSKSLRLTAAIFCVAVIVLTVAIASAGTVAADELVDVNESAESESYLGTVDSDVRLVEGEMTDDDEMELVLEADRSKEIAITDASQEIDGFVDINQRVLTIPEGQSTVRFRVADPDQAAVTIATTENLVGFGQQDFEGSNPSVQWSTAQQLILLTAIGTGAFVFRQVRQKREDSKPDSERVL